MATHDGKADIGESVAGAGRGQGHPLSLRSQLAPSPAAAKVGWALGRATAGRRGPVPLSRP